MTKISRGSLLAATAILTVASGTTAWAQVAAPHISVDPSAGAHPTLSVTANGADQVNIVGPNAAGLSHNRFTEYNVTQNGLILNNATTDTQTQIAGKISANGNLNGTAAKVILNEVTGNDATSLAGKTEVAGQQAAVVIANPNGISCSGCGFVNTSRATLTTGKPIIDDKGALKSLQVTGGNVTFEGAGGDFSTVPVLDIVSRTVTVKDSAKVNAKALNVVAGRNTVDYADVSKVEKLKPEDKNPAPEFAVDTSAMGGMYADKIYMVVNESGAGVRVNGDMAANTGDLFISTAGDIVNNGHIDAKVGRIDLKAAGNLANDSGKVTGSKGVSINTAGDLTNGNEISASNGQIALNSSGKLNNTSGSIKAQNGLNINASGGVDNSATIRNETGKLSINSSGTLNNRSTGSIVNASGAASFNAAGDIGNSGTISNAGGNVDINSSGAFVNAKGGQINNRNGSLRISTTGAVTNNGTISNKNSSSISRNTARTTVNSEASTLQNAGDITVDNSNLTVSSLTKLTNTGTIQGNNADVGLTSSVADVQNSGKVIADSNATVGAGSSLSNKGGTIRSNAGSVALTSGYWSNTDNTSGTIVASRGDVSFSTQNISNAKGSVTAGNSIKGKAGGYTSDADSSFTAGKSMQIAFSGSVQKMGKYGSAASVGPSGSSVVAPPSRVVVAPIPSVVIPTFPAMTNNTSNQTQNSLGMTFPSWMNSFFGGRGW